MQSIPHIVRYQEASSYHDHKVTWANKGTLPNDFLMLAWNARVGYSFDNTLSHPFVAQAGIRSHWENQTLECSSVRREHKWIRKSLSSHQTHDV